MTQYRRCGHLRRGHRPQVIEQFGNKDIAKCPFWKRGDGYFARGRAYALTKASKQAEVDLTHALEFTSLPRSRDSIY